MQCEINKFIINCIFFTDVDLKRRKLIDLRKQRLAKLKNSTKNLFARLLSDDATATSVPSVCYMPLTEKAKNCKRLRRRWYFDPETATCRKFKGCRTGGNNFGKKKRCKRKCLRKGRPSRRKGELTKLILSQIRMTIIVQIVSVQKSRVKDVYVGRRLIE